MVAGPQPDELDALLAQEHEPRERRQLTIMKAEADVFSTVLAEIALRPVPASAPAPASAVAPASAPVPASTSDVATVGPSDGTEAGAEPIDREGDDAPRAAPRGVSLAMEGHDLAAVRAMLDRSRSLTDPADRGLARELRGRALELLGELVALGALTPGPMPREVARAEEDLAIHRDACELREALIAEGAEVGAADLHAARWERGLDRVLSRVHAAIDAHAAELVSGSALDRVGGLEAALAALAPLVPAMRRMERVLRTITADPARASLGGATFGARLGPLLETSYRRVVPITSEAMRKRVVEVLGHLATLRLERAIEPSAHLAWIADALVVGTAPGTAAAGEDASHLARYRSLRAPAARSDLAIVLAEIALLVAHETDASAPPLGRARDALARLPASLRDEIARRDLQAIDRMLACLEAWDAAEPASEALAAVLTDEKALVRSALECELLAALFHDHADAARTFRLRAHALEQTRSTRAVDEARALTDRRWADAREAEPEGARSEG
jgi:hypothetical protein